MYTRKAKNPIYEKIDNNYADFVSGWLEMEPSMLLQEVEEIAATKKVYDELASMSYSDEYLEPLQRFENPLEVVRDAWIAGLGYSDELDMLSIFSDIANDQHIEQKYRFDSKASAEWEPDDNEALLFYRRG